MQCKKCGTILFENDRFCPNCGEPVLENNPQNNNQPMNYQNNNMTYNTFENNNQKTYSNNPNHQKKKSKFPKVLLIILGIIAILVILVILGNINSHKLVCKSKEGTITISYKDNNITSYKAFGFSYDFTEQKKYAKEIGMDAYVKEFNTLFSNNTSSGSCTVDGKPVESTPTDNQEDDTSTIDTKVVGDDNYGYISIPNNWLRYKASEENDFLYYSYANIFIVTMGYFDEGYTAEEYATILMSKQKNSSGVTDVTGATVQIGKDKEYTAYQVYMYYPSDSIYLFTYWFETEDKIVHYLALEGPGEYDNVKITDYLYILESFSMTK